MNRKIIIIFAVLLILTQGCDRAQNERDIRGSWVTAEKLISIEDITSFEVFTPGDIYIKTGKTPKLIVKADDNVMPHLMVREMQGRLVIIPEPGFDFYGVSTPPQSLLRQMGVYTGNTHRAQVIISPRSRIKYYITVPGLETVMAMGKGNVTVQELKGKKITIGNSANNFSIGKLEAEEVVINPSLEGMSYYSRSPSYGEMNIEFLSAEKLELSIYSNADVNIKAGEVRSQKVSIFSHRSYRAPELKTAEADIFINGEGDAAVSVSEKLHVKFADYSGNLFYTGNPKVNIRRRSRVSGKLISASGKIDEQSLIISQGIITEEKVNKIRDKARPMIEKITGRKYISIPEYQLTDQESLYKVMLQKNLKTYSQDLLKYENIIKGVESSTRLESESHIVRYSEQEKKLLIVPENINEARYLLKIKEEDMDDFLFLIIVKEMVHAMDDQHYGLDELLNGVKKSQEKIALYAAVEGYSAYVTEKISKELNIPETVYNLSLIHDLSAPSSTELENNKQYILYYVKGRDFIKAGIEKKGLAVYDSILESPPVSTEQIKFPDKYFDTSGTVN